MIQVVVRVATLTFVLLVLCGRAGAADLTAHGPAFEDLKLWPETDGKPAYKTQAWGRSKILVWAKPGTDGNFDSGGSWLDDGKPASRGPDKDTDVVLPEAAKPYMARAGGGSACRHLTVEKNAAVIAGHPGAFEAVGNVWVKPGGMVHFIDIVGDANTFLRNDNTFPKLNDKALYKMSANNPVHNDPTWSCTHIHHKMVIAKAPKASVELVGQAGIGDELYVAKGTFIIGPNAEFRYRAMAKGSFEVFEGGAVQLQSGAALSTYNNGVYEAMNVSVYRGGELRAGSPDRPIHSDAYLLFAFRGEKVGEDKLGIYTADGAKVRVFSADPKTARLVFTSIISRPDFVGSRGQQIGSPDTKAEKGLGIVMRFAGDVQLNGAVFDYVRPGGLQLADAKMRESWSNITFGPHNAGEESQLLAKMTMATNIYYHQRKYMRMERVKGALGEMKKFEGHAATTRPADARPE